MPDGSRGGAETLAATPANTLLYPLPEFPVHIRGEGTSARRLLLHIRPFSEYRMKVLRFRVGDI